jgi:hypothetical protein
MKKSNKKLQAKQFDSLHDSGADMDQHLDWSEAKRSGLEIQRVNVDFPKWMIEQLDREAKRVGISRQAVIKTWLAERLETAQSRKTA